MAAVTLTAMSMGLGTTEEEFDRWIAYVSAHIDDRVGFHVRVDSFRFDQDVPGPRIVAQPEELEILCDAVLDLWRDWLAEGTP